jgi:two-component system OmpR family response regulator
MAKPFSLQELEARVRALTRRGMGSTTATIKHGPLVYDQAGRMATIDGRMVELSARELGLLEVLLQRVGRLVSKDQLVERLCEWGEEVSNNAIEVYIHDPHRLGSWPRLLFRKNPAATHLMFVRAW